MMRTAKRVALETVGWILVVAGVAALVLPGPGLILLFAGVAVLSQQYEWAERQVDPLKYRAMKGAAYGVASWSRIALSLLGVSWLAACGVVWLVDPDQPDWWPVADALWLPGGAATGVSLVVSAALALALVVWSYHRFNGKPEALEELERQKDAADEKWGR
ncbi:putative transmembrane protein (CHP02611) [Aeromicrobium marinum DSM 15272]|uniref:Transmembrane protein (CHP02611) n=1 Tax=Aeromicrobium marinum DSM 15272 TaxID=585531 RepID=E2S8C8_9ACTN|nr:PGPGW domain-containing protein [Aeromicrobium marinum]EFQ84433.1 putative transmembrane protein (CHP02611) [Aeromicrobium marinum DSM 15272]